MSLSSGQASQALRELEAVTQRSGQLYRYQRFAPMLILWGVIWLIGFSSSHFFPAHAFWAWIALDVIGISGCIYLGRRGKQDASNSTSWRWLASIFSIVVFYIVVQNILQPVSGPQSAALISLIVALCYFLGGVWIGARLAITGIVVAALTLIGFYMFPAYFLLWMAVVGGGSLILAGVWLRTT
ncbi:hypothetical protein [Paraburkholderia phenazinium]|uniref:Uncharacterized protein n=1 Tax=Paraburkholderia phenazinium TaxID=60549 RepID=A0A1G8IL92_9BURK|nr:hypothetical protein [Paraburkholderia phenazinium]SDI19684.1 hypothetical protein SAMN05216466_118153 [Paraburkholderia phenazinium]